jgi:hypothetical protein
MKGVRNTMLSRWLLSIALKLNLKSRAATGRMKSVRNTMHSKGLLAVSKTVILKLNLTDCRTCVMQIRWPVQWIIAELQTSIRDDLEEQVSK